MEEVNAYMRMAKRYPLLTQRDEIELGRRIQRWLTTEDPSPGVVRSGMRARERFILCNLRLVVRMAKFYSRNAGQSGVDIEDLLQEGVIGLSRAAEKYSPTCGYKMSTYAMWWIRQSMSKYLEQRGHQVRVSNRLRKRVYMYERAAALGGTDAEIAERMGVSGIMLRNAALAHGCVRTVPLDAFPPDALPYHQEHGTAGDEYDPDTVLDGLRKHAAATGRALTFGEVVFQPDGACSTGREEALQNIAQTLSCML